MTSENAGENHQNRKRELESCEAAVPAQRARMARPPLHRLAVAQLALEDDGDDGDDDFDKSAPAAVTETPADGPQQTADGSQCVICYEAYTLRGRHQPSALRCGHVFGTDCISRWIRTRTRRDAANQVVPAVCPTCKQPARTRDMRRLLATNVRALDNAQLESALKELKTLKAANERLSADVARLQLMHTASAREADVLRDELFRARAKLVCAAPAAVAPAVAESRPALVEAWSVPVAAAKGEMVRCVAFCPMDDLLVVGKRFGGAQMHGLEFVSVGDPRQRKRIAGIHAQTIRSVRVHAVDGRTRVASAALDKTLALSGPREGVAVWRAKLAAPSWTCCFGVDGDQCVYAGLADGTAVAFDLRFSSRDAAPLAVFSSKSADNVPVSGVHSLEAMANRVLVGASASGIVTWDTRNADAGAVAHPVGIEGMQCTSLRLDELQSDRLSSSWRTPRDASRPATRHVITRVVAQDFSNPVLQVESQLDVDGAPETPSMSQLCGSAFFTCDPRGQAASVYRVGGGDGVLTQPHASVHSCPRPSRLWDVACVRYAEAPAGLERVVNPRHASLGSAASGPHTFAAILHEQSLSLHHFTVPW